MLKSLLRRAFAPLSLSLALVASPAAARAPAAVAKPALWEVSDADTKIYLFGTIHLLPTKYQWRTAKFDEALANSQELVVETLVDAQKYMSAVTSLAFNTPNLPPLSARVPANAREKLAAALRKSGYPPQAFDRVETWAVAVTLLSDRFREMGLKGDEGVEMILRNAFASKGKPIGELETTVQQLGYFDTLPESAQRQLLEGAIQDKGSMEKDFGGMLRAWTRGDVPGIAVTFNRDLSESPEIKQALLARRNANWAHWIEQRLAKPGQIMIAVGAGHLAGSDSVIELLKRDRYRVRRVQ